MKQTVALNSCDMEARERCDRLQIKSGITE